ncbi:hypothetical protein [Paracoccus seriniphilus]|uniref:hypothetical protein n=1 Tax=Paracoccus seriniphilus TaxID=184748 RepID=UPI0011816854|nr:hypothetical protein [Paracoccus seriniphilus]WCR13239.1 hypothetical protein JHW44_09825 [Paracoccus seriniphilus]
MDMNAILARISSRIELMNADGQKTSERAISMAATGSSDTIRNWRRSVAAGKPASATIAKIEQVAAALGVTPDWLLTGEGPDPAPEDSVISEIVDLLHQLDASELQMIRAAARGFRDQNREESE